MAAKTRILIIISLLIALCLTRFWNIGFPSKVVFDEAHFGLYASKYLSHSYYFDIHPPLGKLFFALVAKISNFGSDFYFTEGANYGNLNYVPLRFFNALIGVFFIFIVYLLAKEIGFSKRIAFIAGFLIAFDNALILESRLILLNTLLLFFIFLSIYLFFKAQNNQNNTKKCFFLIFLTALSSGVAISIKWSGFGLFLLFFLLIFFSKKLRYKQKIMQIIVLLSVSLLVYVFAFFVHFQLAYYPCSENCGWALDYYRSRCDSCVFYTIPSESNNFFTKLLLVHNWMFLLNVPESSFDTFPYESNWFSWPLMLRPIPYFPENSIFSSGGESYQNAGIGNNYLFLIGNPAIWWLGSLSIVFGIIYLLWKKIFKKEIFETNQYSLIIIIFGYFCFLLPFIFIRRFLLIYLYFPSLAFSIICLAIVFDSVIRKIFKEENGGEKFFYQNKKANLALISFLLIILAVFIFFSPLTYGFPLSGKGLNLRMWGGDMWRPVLELHQ